jgi:ABC-type lipoprotein release transport system permease subunit
MLKLAWRNIWRNRSRSLISIAAVMFSVFFAVVMRAFALGTYDHMIDSVMGNYFGYIQLHAEGYWNDQTLENTFEIDGAVHAELRKHPDVIQVVARLESFSLVSSGEITKGGLVLGIDPTNELPGLQLEKRLVEGAFFEAGDQSVVIGKDLASYLQVGADDTLYFIGQGYRAQSAYGKYHIKGVVNMQNPEFNRSMVLMPLKEAQWMFACEERLTTYALRLETGADYRELAAELALDTTALAGLEIMTWEELFPDVVQGIQADSAGGLVFILILYVIIGFVLLGTVIMMVAEREVEFGILVSIGMRKGLLAWVTVLENVLLSLLGGMLGILLARPSTVYFNRNPIEFSDQMSAAMEEFGYEAIMPASIQWDIPLTHAAIVTCIAIAVSLYAVLKIRFLKPVEAIRP